MDDATEESPHPNPLPAIPGEGTETPLLDRESAADSADERDERLAEIVTAYSIELEAGRRPDRRALIKRHPDLAEDLSACLGGLSFLQSAANQLAASAADAGDITTGGPQPLGDYRLLKEIGRGGMGIVYEAEQLSLGRRVAVKVLPMAAALDERQLTRFRNEASAAAQLHHTNIVPVYAVGCERSMHFYAMQLIDGQSLADVIRDLRASAIDRETFANSSDLTVPSQTLSSLRTTKRMGFYQTVARLGLQAAEALHYAHHAGIVHRDIKPANLLLDGQSNVWVTDFGLAQFYNAENNLTQSQDRPGTLRYMSPEQASGRAVVLDQRTDVYSLGVTLYELLTLERAVPGETREQLMHNLEKSEPKSARAIDAGVPKELETVLATACAKEPADRYATAGALAEDLRRFLQDRPILARPPSLTQHAVRFLWRHHTLAWAGLAVLLILLAGFVVSTVLIAREQVKTSAALLGEKERAAEATRQRLLAQRGFNEARDAVAFFTRIAASEMSDDRPSPEVRREMLEASLDYYESFLNERHDDPASSRELVEAQTYVSRLLSELQGVEDVFRLRTLLRLLNDSAVAAQLRLTPDQVGKVRQLANDLRSGTFDNFHGDPNDAPPGSAQTDAQRQRLSKLGKDIRGRLNDLLSVTQFERLHQIERQVRGPASFSDGELAKALILTPAQKDAMRPLLASYRTASRRPPPPPQNADNDSVRPTWSETRARTLTALEHLLDTYQLAAWRALCGDPFLNAERLDQDNGRHHPFGHGPNEWFRQDDHGPNDGGPGGPPPEDGFGR